jgi:cytochrome c biogenesis protein CcdA
MFSFPLLITIYAGFAHAFEADHLLAVSNIASRRTSTRLCLKDGIYWGLGHASTIFFIGILMIVFKTAISNTMFHYFEALVGCMLISLAVYRLIKFFSPHTFSVDPQVAHVQGDDVHPVNAGSGKHTHEHSLAYGVGLIHGLAGSGALLLVVMSQMKNSVDGLLYLLIFGTGCLAGMLVASGLFSIPFSKKMMQAQTLQSFLIIISSVLCLLFGGKVIYDNLIA